MGNNESVTSGNKAQGDKTSCEWYKYLVLPGEGEFVELMKQCNQARKYDAIDDAIRQNLRPYLYNGGEGEYRTAAEIIHVRQCIRNGEGITEWNPAMPNHEENGTTIANGSRVKVAPSPDAEARLSSMKKRRLVCWRLDKRGAVGETILHTAILLASPLMIQLAKRMLKVYPKLIVDIYLSDQYYGENVLHLSIVNEDPQMVKFLLDTDRDHVTHSERAFGVFFSCDDQKEYRKDIQDDEIITINKKTNYQGYVYWGEYPLSFAACLEQEECLRLLFAKGAKLDASDHNGNTVLHMAVIYNKIEMFDLVLQLADKDASRLLTIKNQMGLTPLTLAAQMAHKDMYNHIIEKERKVYWVYGDVTCAAYPLENIDSIGESGQINDKSALHLIIYGEKKGASGHLEMVDGMIVHILNDKWSTFVRRHFAVRMACFILYFIILSVAILLRPGVDRHAGTTGNYTMANGTSVSHTFENNSCYLLGPSAEYQRIMKLKGEIYFPVDDIIRLTFECLALAGCLIYLLQAARMRYWNGQTRFLEMLKSAPSMTMFYIGCICLLLMVPGRVLCHLPGKHGWRAAGYEDVMAVFTILLTAIYSLFFCRGFKIVGPFILMIYKMLKGDLLRFFTIYVIFLLGFSQAMFIVHINFDKENKTDIPFRRQDYAIMGMFYMSMGEFTAMYEDLTYTQHEIMGKTLFVFYMVLVTVLLINMLIAMMGNTYTLVNETQKEWLRQYAVIILCIEQGVSPGERLNQQERYSQPMDEDDQKPKKTDDSMKRRAIAIRWHHSEKEKEDIKKEREAIKMKQKEVLLKHSRQDLQATSDGVVS